MGRIKKRIPPWIKYKIPGGKTYVSVKNTIQSNKLHTVCTEAKCPNIGECFGSGTATFIIMGNICTRNCRYCSIVQGIPEPLDKNEPKKIANSIKILSLNYAVITSVTRDDLDDGGANHFVQVVNEIKKKSSDTTIELLVPDFGLSMDSSLDTVLESRPDLLNHNIEVVKKYYDNLRPMGNYNKSLELLKNAARYGGPVKSGLMIGFGENMDDIKETLNDLIETGCTIVTVGQYLQSLKENMAVEKFYHPDEFMEIEKLALEIGFKKVFAGPLVRSSYHAKDLY